MAANKENKVQISFRVPEDFKVEWEVKLARTKQDQQSALISMMREYIAADMLPSPPPPAPSWSPESEPLHQKLESILTSGDEKTIDAVVSNIEVFFERLRPARGAARRPEIGQVLVVKPEEARLIHDFRDSTVDKQRVIRATAAKGETLEPQVMSPSQRAARRKHG